MKATLCFTALEFLILVLQSAAMGGILVLMILTGANVPRLLIGAATLALVLAKVVTGNATRKTCREMRIRHFTDGPLSTRPPP